MISFKSIAHFRQRLSDLLKVKRGIYSGITMEISKEFQNKL